MDKFNSFCEKYEVALWMVAAAIWFYVEFATNNLIGSLFGAGVVWTVLAIIEFARIYLKNKPENKGSKKSKK